jgi:hypothetical protein
VLAPFCKAPWLAANIFKVTYFVTWPSFVFKLIIPIKCLNLAHDFG